MAYPIYLFHNSFCGVWNEFGGFFELTRGSRLRPRRLACSRPLSLPENGDKSDPDLTFASCFFQLLIELALLRPLPAKVQVQVVVVVFELLLLEES